MYFFHGFIITKALQSLSKVGFPAIHKHYKTLITFFMFLRLNGALFLQK